MSAPNTARLLHTYSRGTAREWPLALLGWNLAVAGALQSEWDKGVDAIADQLCWANRCMVAYEKKLYSLSVDPDEVVPAPCAVCDDP